MSSCPGSRLTLVPEFVAVIAVSLSLAPSTSPASPLPRTGFDPHVFVVTTDYGATGSASAIDVDAPWAVERNVEGVGSDPKVRHALGRHYVINRYLGDNIQIIDPATFATIRQFSTGAGTNPQDIAVVSETKAYVTAYDDTDLLIVNPSTGAITGGIDLGVFADGDGLPEMNTMEIVGARLFVQLQRLDRDDFYTPVFPSYLAVIDITTDTILDADPGAPGVQAIALTGTNPVCRMSVDIGAARLHVAEIGAYGALDGGIDIVDTDALIALGFAVTESALGGDVGCFSMCAGTGGYVLSSDDFFFSSRLQPFDIAGNLGAIMYTTESFTEAISCDAPTGQLFLGVRDVSAPGVRVFDADSGNQLTTSPIDVGLPPADLVIARSEPLGSDDVASELPGGVTIAPNPLRTSAIVRFAASPGDRVGAEIFDVAGRSVRVLADGLETRNGWNTLSWDATDASGSPVAPGPYWLRIVGERGSARAQVVKLVVGSR